MPKLNDLYPSKYLKAADIEGHEPVVTIESVSVEELGQGEEKDTKPVLYFAGKDKGLCLNLTNANTIALLFNSDNTDDWMGKKIKLFVDIVAFKGKATKAIRVKNGEPLPVKPGATAKPSQTAKETIPPAHVTGPATGNQWPNDLNMDENPPF